MTYFLLESDKLYENTPVSKGLPPEFNVQDIMNVEYKNFPDIGLVFIHENKETQFIDCVSSPFTMVNEKCMEVINMYKPSIMAKIIVLLDTKNELTGTYYVPLLPKIDCLTSNSKFNLDKSYIEYAEIDLSKVGNAPIFYLDGVKKGVIVIRLDVVESMLKRGVTGLYLKKLDVI